jgi:hypothetical protein
MVDFADVDCSEKAFRGLNAVFRREETTPNGKPNGCRLYNEGSAMIHLGSLEADEERGGRSDFAFEQVVFPGTAVEVWPSDMVKLYRDDQHACVTLAAPVRLFAQPETVPAEETLVVERRRRFTQAELAAVAQDQRGVRSYLSRAETSGEHRLAGEGVEYARTKVLLQKDARRGTLVTREGEGGVSVGVQFGTRMRHERTLEIGETATVPAGWVLKLYSDDNEGFQYFRAPT